MSSVKNSTNLMKLNLTGDALCTQSRAGCYYVSNKLDHYTTARVSVTEVYHYRALVQGRRPIFLMDGDVGADLA